MLGKRSIRLPSRLKSSYLRGRIITTIIVFFIVYVINFIIPHLEPGSVLAAIGSSNLLPRRGPSCFRCSGLNQPLSQQFVEYVRGTLLTFPPNFGVSFAHYPISVWALVSVALPWTLLLVGDCARPSLGPWASSWVPGWPGTEVRGPILRCWVSPISCGASPATGWQRS